MGPLRRLFGLRKGAAADQNERGLACVGRGDSGQAIVESAKAIQLDRSDAKFYVNRGTTYLRVGAPAACSEPRTSLACYGWCSIRSFCDPSWVDDRFLSRLFKPPPGRVQSGCAGPGARIDGYRSDHVPRHYGFF